MYASRVVSEICVGKKQRLLADRPFPPYREGMPSDRSSLVALRNLIAETDLILETTPDLPQNRTGCCRENLRAALALADDLLKQQRMTAAAVMGPQGRQHDGEEARRGPLPQNGGGAQNTRRRHPVSKPNKPPQRSQVARMGVLKRKARHGGRGSSMRTLDTLIVALARAARNGFNDGRR